MKSSRRVALVVTAMLILAPVVVRADDITTQGWIDGPFFDLLGRFGDLYSSYTATAYSIGRILLAPGIYLAMDTIQGQVITPMVLGRRFALNPVVIFIWLIFWGWLWGIIGALLAFPMLTVFKILCDHIRSLEPMGGFLER